MPSMVGVMADSYNKPAGGGSLPVTAGLLLWFDADDAASFTYSSGVVVSQWADKSGLNTHANVDGAITKPSRTAAAINGRAAVYFSNATLRSTSSSGQSPFTLIAVVKHDDFGGYYCHVGATVNGGLEIRMNWTGTATSVVQAFAANVGTLGASTGTAAFATPNIITMTHSGTAANFFINGVAAGTPANSQALTASETRLGYSVSGNGMKGYMAEFIKYNRVINSTERGQLETYLKTKWGTP